VAIDILPAANYNMLCASPLCTVACRIAKRKQALPAKDRRQLGYAVQTGKKDTGKTVLLTEDVAEALQEVSWWCRAQ
jgi:hypothetical protein